MAYLDSTYEAATSWIEETVISYVPHAKKAGTISAERYDRYAVATTIREALALGSKKADLLHDYERKFLIVAPVQPNVENPTRMTLGRNHVKEVQKVAAGPASASHEQAAAPRAAAVRPAAVQPQREHAAPSDTPAKLAATQTKEKAEKAPKVEKADDPLAKLRLDKKEQMFVLMEALGLDVKLAKDMKGGDNVEMMTERLMADRLAQIIIKAAEEQSRKITNREVLAVLKLWHFKKNEARQNVIPGGQKWVHSDTFGLIRCRTGEWFVTNPTQEYPQVSRILNTWLKQRLPEGMEGEFPCTSISLNSNYAAKRHRDGNNAGPSMIAGFGDYTGGELAYWSEDDRSGTVEELNHKDRKVFDISKGLVLFDGVRGHEVNDFQGERYSVVWFNASKFWTMGKEIKDYLRDCGFGASENEDLSKVMKFLPPARGYSGSKSLAGCFGLKDTRPPPPVNEWANVEDEREEQQAQELLSGHAAERESFVKVKEVFDAAVHAANKAEEEKEEQEQKSRAMQQLFGKKETQAEPKAPASPQPTNRGEIDSMYTGMSGEKRRAPDKTLLGQVNEAAPPAKRSCSVPASAPALSNEEVQRGDLAALFRVLECGSGAALADYFCCVLRGGKQVEQHLRAVLELLAPHGQLPVTVLRLAIAEACACTVGPEEDLAKAVLKKRGVRRWGQPSITVFCVADGLRATVNEFQEMRMLIGEAAAAKQRQAVQRLAEVLSRAEGRDAELLVTILQGTLPVSRGDVLVAVGQAFTLLRPGAEAEPRIFPTESAKQAYSSAMHKLLPVAFGELGGRCDELLAALMEDISPNALPGRCRPSAGKLVLPMEAGATACADEALLRMAGFDIAVEFCYSGHRVQIHRFGDCIAIFEDGQDLGAPQEQLDALREAIASKACIIEAVAVATDSGDVCFQAFDCLLLNGQSLTRRCLKDRYEALQQVIQPCEFMEVVPQERYTVEEGFSAEQVRDLLEDSRVCTSPSCKGLVLKRLSSSYEAGQTSEAWVSLTH